MLQEYFWIVLAGVTDGPMKCRSDLLLVSFCLCDVSFVSSAVTYPLNTVLTLYVTEMEEAMKQLQPREMKPRESALLCSLLTPLGVARKS